MTSRLPGILCGARSLLKPSQFACVKRSQSGGANPRIKALQEHFQKDDGRPVHLKGGPFDVILYRFTMGLCITAVIMNFHFFYSKITAKKG